MLKHNKLMLLFDSTGGKWGYHWRLTSNTCADRAWRTREEADRFLDRLRLHFGLSLSHSEQRKQGLQSWVIEGHYWVKYHLDLESFYALPVIDVLKVTDNAADTIALITEAEDERRVLNILNAGCFRPEFTHGETGPVSWRKRYPQELARLSAEVERLNQENTDLADQLYRAASARHAPMRGRYVE